MTEGQRLKKSRQFEAEKEEGRRGESGDGKEHDIEERTRFCSG